MCLVLLLTFVSCVSPIATAEQAYHSDNPYHNCTHAADVLQALHCLIMDSPVSDGHIHTHTHSSTVPIFSFLGLPLPQLCEEMTLTEYLGATLAAICHDVDHPGVNQTFLINTSSYLASIHGVSPMKCS